MYVLNRNQINCKKYKSYDFPDQNSQHFLHLHILTLSTTIFRELFAKDKDFTQGLKLVQVRRLEICCFLNESVEFLKISIEKVLILRKWVLLTGLLMLCCNFIHC